MKFIDQATITVQAGKGGAGSRHFRREKFVPQGGPDGGNGGRGGSVIFQADLNTQTLLDFRFQAAWKAEDGKAGLGSGKEGKSGKDLIIKLPVGTQAYDQNNNLIADLDKSTSRVVVAKGGRGGKGNEFFKSPTNQSPEHFQPGEPGQEFCLDLTLKLVADVGLVGFPNAGKSTLISRISAARPKIADYPFTTLVPNLGVVRGKHGGSFVVADIPGLVPDAHLGKGLGIRFLQHIERTKILVHLVDPYQIGPDGELVDALESYKQISLELRAFSENLTQKKRIVVISKADALNDPEVREKLLADFTAAGIPVSFISSMSGEGLEGLLGEIERELALVGPVKEESHDMGVSQELPDSNE